MVVALLDLLLGAVVLGVIAKNQARVRVTHHVRQEYGIKPDGSETHREDMTQGMQRVIGGADLTSNLAEGQGHAAKYVGRLFPQDGCRAEMLRVQRLKGIETTGRERDEASIRLCAGNVQAVVVDVDVRNTKIAQFSQAHAGF